MPDDAAALEAMLAVAQRTGELAFEAKFGDAFPLRAAQQNMLQASIRAAIAAVAPVIIEYAARKAVYDASHEIAEAWLARGGR